MKIVRTKTRAEGGLTEEEKILLKAHSDLWIKRAMRTEKIEPEKIIPAIEKLYEVSGLKKPRVVIVSSPLVMAFSYGFATALLEWKTAGRDIRADRWLINGEAHAPIAAETLEAIMECLNLGAVNNPGRAIISPLYESLSSTWAYDLALKISGNKKDALYMLECAKKWSNNYQGGNMWAGWDCYLSSFRDVLKLELPIFEKYKAWEECAINGGFRVLHEDFCIVSDFPEILTVDSQNRPHGDKAPSHKWRDGFALYYHHGVRVTEQIILKPETLTVKQIEDEENAEVRRVMIEKFGEGKYLETSGAKLIHKDEFGQLYRKEVKDDEPLVMVRVENSTMEVDDKGKLFARTFYIRVPPDTKTAKEAVAWTFNKKSEEYNPRVQS